MSRHSAPTSLIRMIATHALALTGFILKWGAVAAVYTLTVIGLFTVLIEVFGNG